MEQEEGPEEIPAPNGRWLAPLAGAACGALGGALGVTLVASAGPVLGGGAAVAAGAALVTRALTSAPPHSPDVASPDASTDEANEDRAPSGEEEAFADAMLRRSVLASWPSKRRWHRP